MTGSAAQYARPQGYSGFGLGLKLRQSVGKQIVCDRVTGLLREMQRPPRHFAFFETAVSRYFLHHPPAAVACLKIAQRVGAGRVFSQLDLHQADVFENNLEVELAQGPKRFPERVRGRDRLGRFPVC